MTSHAPALGGPVIGEEIPRVAVLDWYIATLLEERNHDLSHSGLMYDWWPLLEDAGSLISHPMMDGIDVAQMVADRYGVDKDRVTLTHGTTDAIHIALMAALPPGARRIAVELPSYAPIAQTPRLMGLETVAFDRIIDGVGAWRLDRDRLSDLIPQVDGVLITPVMNPTGFLLPEEDLRWLAEACRMEGIPLISDEVYNDASLGSDDYLPAHSLGEHCVSIASLTKIYGLGTLRIGWMISSTRIARTAMDIFRTLCGMISSPAERLAAEAWPHLHLAHEAIEKRREHGIPLLQSMLDKHGIEWTPPPNGLFGAFDIGVDAKQVIDTIGREEDFIAMPCGLFHDDLSTWLRVAWSKTPEEFAEDVKVLDRVLTRVQT